MVLKNRKVVVLFAKYFPLLIMLVVLLSPVILFLVISFIHGQDSINLSSVQVLSPVILFLVISH